MRQRTLGLVFAAMLATTAGFTALSVSPASASIVCQYGQYGVSGDGWATYWGWCHPNGQSIHFRLAVVCPYGGGGVTAEATGSGYGTVYTESETCWLGQSATSTTIVG
jgi:hypothetical protein